MKTRAVILEALACAALVIGTVMAFSSNSAVPAPADQYVIHVLVVNEEGEPVASFRYLGPPEHPAFYDTQEICEASVNTDTTFKSSLDDLKKIAAEREGPNATIEVYCELSPDTL
jgi:hypothetical protein